MRLAHRITDDAGLEPRLAHGPRISLRAEAGIRVGAWQLPVLESGMRHMRNAPMPQLQQMPGRLIAGGGFIGHHHRDIRKNAPVHLDDRDALLLQRGNPELVGAAFLLGCPGDDQAVHLPVEGQLQLPGLILRPAAVVIG